MNIGLIIVGILAILAISLWVCFGPFWKALYRIAKIQSTIGHIHRTEDPEELCRLGGIVLAELPQTVGFLEIPQEKGGISICRRDIDPESRGLDVWTLVDVALYIAKEFRN